MTTQSNSGFSLIEVMCAILILGVALAGLTQGISGAIRSGKESEIQTTAALLAAGQIETLRADKTLEDGETDGDCTTNFPAYHWRQLITSTDINGLHEVKVSIESTNSGRVIYELRTMLFDPSTLTETTVKKTKGSKDTTTKSGKTSRRRERSRE